MYPHQTLNLQQGTVPVTTHFHIFFLPFLCPCRASLPPTHTCTHMQHMYMHISQATYTQRHTLTGTPACVFTLTHHAHAYTTETTHTLPGQNGTGLRSQAPQALAEPSCRSNLHGRGILLPGRSPGMATLPGKRRQGALSCQKRGTQRPGNTG